MQGHGSLLARFSRRAGFLGMVFSSFFCLPLVQAQKNPVNPDEAALMQLQRDWAEARKHADIPTLEKLYAEEFSVGIMNGGENTRAQDLAMFSSGDLKPAVIRDTAMQVHVYGEAAMVTGLEHLEGTYKGHTGQFDLRFTNVWVFRDSRWQLVRHQATPLAKK